MKILLLFFAIIAINLQFGSTTTTNLTARHFQKDFLNELNAVMKKSALEYLNNYLKDIEKPPQTDEVFDEALSTARSSKKLETKIVFLKQWFDMAEHRDSNRGNMYGMRNVLFLKRLKDKFHDMQEDSFNEIHNLRYFYLCKQFNIANGTEDEEQKLGSRRQSRLLEENVVGILDKLGAKDKHTISINVTEFGLEIYRRVNHTGSELINDYLVVIKKLVQEVLENKQEVFAQNNDALQKILLEVDHLLNTTDFYSKRQRLYDYLENHLALDYEEFKNSENSQQDLVEIFLKLKQKGLDLIVAFLFSNFEFVDYTHDQWSLLLPDAPVSLYEEANSSQLLRKIQQLYAEFKQDFENSSKYDAYLEAVKVLHEQTQRENADTSHIYEMLYSASQNVGSSRATLMNAKCNEI